MSRPSFVRYPPSCRFGLTPGSGGVDAIVVDRMSLDSVHTALASSETSTMDASPVRSRRKRAAAMPYARFIAAGLSPIAPRDATSPV